MSLPSPSFWAGKLTRKTKYRHEKMDLLLSAWLENLFLEKKKKDYYVLQMLNEKKKTPPQALFF
jgi:hypothetical protein